MRECVKEDEGERDIYRDRQTDRDRERGGRKRMRDCEGG